MREVRGEKREGRTETEHKEDELEDEYFDEMIEEEEILEDELVASFWLKLLVISSATFLLLSILYQFFCRPSNNNATVYIKEDKLLLQ